MDIVNIIGHQGEERISAMGKQYGLDDRQSRMAVEQLAPVVMAGLRRNSQSAEGVSGLIKALASGGHSRYVEREEAGITDDGNAILGHVFGSKEVSRGVAAEAAARSGIDAATLKKMLPVVAAMVMGALSKSMAGPGATTQSASAGGLGDILGSVLGGGAGTQGATGGLGGILQQALGGAPGGSPAGGGGLADAIGGLLRGQSAAAGQRQAGGNGGISDVLGSIFGASAASSTREEATKRAGESFDRMLGGGTASGSDADELLSSLTRSFGKR